MRTHTQQHDSSGPLPRPCSLRFRVIAYDPQTKGDEDCGIIDAESWVEAWKMVECRYNFPRRMIPVPTNEIEFPRPERQGSGTRAQDFMSTADQLRALPASDLFAPWWAVNVPDSEDDNTCTRCGHVVHLEHDSEWLGPDDNYHWNLCNSCAQELVLEMWRKLEAVANIVTTDHETKEAFIGRVRAVLWANTAARHAAPESDTTTEP